MARRGPPRRRKAPKAARTDLVIERLGAAGDGLAGEVAVPFALPGERVRAEVSGRKARLTEILAPSGARAAPPCRHFGLPGDGCGGCKLQHLDTEAYRAFKRDRLAAAVARAGFSVPEIAVHASPPRSRRRAKLAFERRRGGVAAGFRALGTDRLVALEECRVLTPPLFDLARALPALVGVLPFERAAEALVTMTDTGADVAVTGVDEAALPLPAREAAARIAGELDLARLSVGGVPLAERRTPALDLGGATVALPPAAFLQATREGEAALVRLVTEGLGGAAAVADLFCGVGTFALPVSRGARVLAAESDEASVTALSQAAKPAGRPVRAERRDLFARPLVPSELEGFGAVVLDPPRAGALAQCEALVASAVPRVVYVSCNPDALARDLRALVPRYDLTRLALVDQFVWSPHIEAVAVLERKT